MDAIFSLIAGLGRSIPTISVHLFYNMTLYLIYWNSVKFIIDNMWLIALALISGLALLIPMMQRSGAKVSVLQATQLMNQGKCTVLDVRDAAEYAAGHIKNARNIPLAELAARSAELDKVKNQTVIAVCATGRRSATAVALLNRAAFTQTVSLDGGMAGWREQGLPTVK